MRLLDRYLLRELLMPLAVCLSGFTLFWVAFDLLGELDRFRQAGLGVSGIGFYYLVGLPELLNTILPVALLLALLYTLTAHSRHNEITAMRAAGISLWRIILPYFAIGLLASGFLYWLSEKVAPDSRERQERLLEGSAAASTDGPDWRGPLNFDNQPARRSWSIGGFDLRSGALRNIRLLLPVGEGARREVTVASALWTNGDWRLAGVSERLWRRQDDPSPATRETAFTPLPRIPATNLVVAWPGGSFAVSNAVVRTNLVFSDPALRLQWNAASYDPRTAEIRGLVLQEPLDKGAQRQFLADGAVWDSEGWRFTNGNEYIFRNNRDREPLWMPSMERLPETDESPEILRSEFRVAGFNRVRALKKPELTVRQILDYQRLHPDLRPDMRAWLETQLHARVAAPWTCLVVVFIAVPFAAPSGRRNLFFGVAGSIGLAFIYFVVQRVGFALGQNGAVAPWIGAWLPNAAFTLAGLILTARVR
jgi:lipopolysaccharide export LptBFGC system permease protein LptF